MTASHQNPVQSISVRLESKAHLVNQGLVQFQMFNVCIVPTLRGIIIMYISHEILRLFVNLRRVGHSARYSFLKLIKQYIDPLRVINNSEESVMRKGENIFKRKDGRWEARYIKGYELSGKAKYGFCYGKSYKEAKEKVTKYKVALLAGKPIPQTGARHRFAFYCDEWLCFAKKGQRVYVYQIQSRA